MYLYDIFAIIFIGISHVLLYIFLIRYNRLSYKMVLALSIIFSILLGIVVTVSGYPEFNIIMLFIFLLSLGLLKNGLPLLQNIYFALVSMVLITLVKSVLIEIGTEIFMLSPFNLYLWTGSVIHLVVATIILTNIIIFRHQIQTFAAFIVECPLYYI